MSVMGVIRCIYDVYGIKNNVNLSGVCLMESSFFSNAGTKGFQHARDTI